MNISVGKVSCMHLKIGYPHIVIEISRFLFHAYLEKEKSTKNMKCQCVTFMLAQPIFGPYTENTLYFLILLKLFVNYKFNGLHYA